MKYILNSKVIITYAISLIIVSCDDRREPPPSSEQNPRVGVVDQVREITSESDKVMSGAQGAKQGSYKYGERPAESEAVPAAEQPAISAAPRFEIAVKLRDGGRIKVTQHEVLEVGDSVRVISINGEARVINSGLSEMKFATLVKGAIAYRDALELTTFGPHVRDVGTPLPSLPAGVQYYSWNQYQGFATVMMAVNEGICFLQGVTGKFRGEGESIWVRNNGSRWELNGTSLQQDVSARAMCVPFSAIQGADQGISYFTGTASQWVKNRSGCSWWESCNPTASQSRRLAGRDHFCYLTGMAGLFDGGGEAVSASAYGPTSWDLLAVTSAWRGYIRGEAGCLALVGHGQLRTTNVVFNYTWSQGEPFRQLPNADQAFCALNWIQGRFAGWGETLEIYHNPDLTQWLGGSSYQEGVKAHASCFYYNQRL